MRLTTPHHAQRGETIVALIRAELSQADEPIHLVFVRLGHRDGRTEQWAQVARDERDALERYSRAVEDFIAPIPYSVAPVSP